jgi:Domain of unknown function (DUF5060)
MQIKKWPSQRQLLLAAILMPQLASAGALLSPSYSQAAEQWGIEELTLHSKHQYSNPITEVKLTGRFTCAGQTTQSAGFFDGGDTWKIRFMPRIQGACEFLTAPNDSELNDVEGKFNVGLAFGR